MAQYVKAPVTKPDDLNLSSIPEAYMLERKNREVVIWPPHMRCGMHMCVCVCEHSHILNKKLNTQINKC